MLRTKSDNIHCVVHETSAEWFLVEEITDLHFDGFSLIANNTVKARRYNQVDKTVEKVLRNERVRPSNPPLSVAGPDKDLFTRLSKIDTLVTVQADDETRFLIGKIHRTTSRRLFMKHFTAAGKWFARPSGIDFYEIGRVRFLHEYGKAWHRFFKS